MARAGDKLLLPEDHVVVSELKEGAASEVVQTIPRQNGRGHRAEDDGALFASDRRREDHYLELVRWAYSKSSPSIADSSDAPPPVEMCEILSATPRTSRLFRIAAPTTETAPDDSTGLGHRYRVPRSKGLISNTPIGPFR